MAKEKKEEIIETKYSKEQILKSKRYAHRKDLLNISLEEDKEYSFKEIDKIIEDFMNKEVK